MTDAVHPAFVYLAGAVLVAVTSGRWRPAVILTVPAVALAVVASLSDPVELRTVVFGQELHLLRVDAWSRLFGLVFAVTGLLGSVYGLHVRGRGPHAAAFAYAGSALGVVFAGDLLTLFVFWEAMAVASAFLIFQRRAPRALGAGYRYLLVHGFGGAALLGGIILHAADGASLAFGAMSLTGATALILLGFAINAAIPPLHAWLTDAYPEATVIGAVFLSAFTTKTAVYALARGFPGEPLLVWAGVAMALYGVVFAVLENDIRRLLAYHIVSQVGYMVCGIGIGTPLALAGAAAHAFSHILYKGLLFMGTGAVLEMTGRSRLTELGGLARLMPWTLAFYTVGAFSISGVPLFNGFVSKALVVAAAEHEHLVVVEWLLILASIGTFLHTGLKLPWFTFFAAPRALRATDPPLNMRVAMAGAAALCVLFGVAPDLLYRLLPHPVTYAPYTGAHVLTTLQLLLGTALGFAWLLPKLGEEPTVTYDTDWFYRRGAALAIAGCRAAATMAAHSSAATAAAGDRLAAALWRPGGRAADLAAARIGPWIAAGVGVLVVLVLLLA